MNSLYQVNLFCIVIRVKIFISNHTMYLKLSANCVLYCISAHNTVIVKKKYFRSVPPRPDAIALFMPAILFPFRMHVCIISNWACMHAWSVDMQKMKVQLIHSPTGINSFILLRSSKLFWGSSLLPVFDFE